MTEPDQPSRRVEIPAADNIINIDYSLAQYEQDLTARQNSVRRKLGKTNETGNKRQKQERKLLERELSDIQNQLQNIAASYRRHVVFLGSSIKELQAISEPEDEARVSEAIQALKQGETTKADQLLKEIDERQKPSIERAAKAAFERGKISIDKSDYQNAFLHFERSVGLSSDNPGYLGLAGNAAGLVANHQKEIE